MSDSHQNHGFDSQDALQCDIDLLERLTHAYGPIGQEDEIREFCQREIKPFVQSSWCDAAGNLIAHTTGDSSDPSKSVHVLSHLDEICLIVRRVDDDGLIEVTDMGGTSPLTFGQGAVDLLCPDGPIAGVLSLGSMHTNDPQTAIWKTKPDGGNQALRFPMMRVHTGFSYQELADRGVRPGTRVVVARSRRKVTRLGNGQIGGFFLDDRAPVAGMIHLLRQRASVQPLPGDVHWIFSVQEETGGIGAAYAQKTLPAQISIALETAPADDHFGVAFSDQPVVIYHDTWSSSDKHLCDQIMQIGTEIGLRPQAAVYTDYGSDASVAKRYGIVARSVTLGIPTRSTHGYEMIHMNGISNLTKLVEAFLERM